MSKLFKETMEIIKNLNTENKLGRGRLFTLGGWFTHCSNLGRRVPHLYRYIDRKVVISLNET